MKFFDLDILYREPVPGMPTVLTAVVTSDGFGRIIGNPLAFQAGFEAIRATHAPALSLVEDDGWGTFLIVGFVSNGRTVEEVKESAEEFAVLAQEHLGFHCRQVHHSTYRHLDLTPLH